MTTSLVRQVLPRPRPRPTTADVHGTTAPGFASVRHSFERACRDAGPAGSQGAALAVVRHGETVVDLWHGTADPVTGTPWTGDTLEPVLTGSHGILATAVLLLADMGALALDRPVADYWPEFAMRGKGAVTLRDVLTFTARLPGMAADLDQRDVENPQMMAALLELHSPEDDPRAGGVLHGPWTAGWIAAEVIRRVDGRDLDLFFLEEIAGPLGLDIHFGLVPDQLPHTARISYDAGLPRPLPGTGRRDGPQRCGRPWCGPLRAGVEQPVAVPRGRRGVERELGRRYAVIPSLGRTRRPAASPGSRASWRRTPYGPRARSRCCCRAARWTRRGASGSRAWIRCSAGSARTARAASSSSTRACTRTSAPAPSATRVPAESPTRPGRRPEPGPPWSAAG